MKKIFEGKVVSVGMKRTVVVEVVRKKPHPMYRKLLTRSKKMKADTSGKEVVVGNTVRIEETRPMASSKHFKVVEVIS